MKYYISLGSNVGDRVGNLKKALVLLKKLGKILKKSALYQTEPIGVKDQYLFLNAVVTFESSIAPKEFLEKVKTIELQTGRHETYRWGPREIDIDIIDYDGEEVDTPRLRLPHTEFEKRRFVLIPLLEIDDEFKNREGNSIQELLLSCPDTGHVDLFLQKW
jgi:2-amino-4-hydroxy-6-hydroxymethyldihydropteridine diphosphokinase